MVSTTSEPPLGRSERRTMICEGCLQIRPWTPWLRCCRECYNMARATLIEQATAKAAASDAFAYFASLQPGRSDGVADR